MAAMLAREHGHHERIRLIRWRWDWLRGFPSVLERLRANDSVIRWLRRRKSTETLAGGHNGDALNIMRGRARGAPHAVTVR